MANTASIDPGQAEVTHNALATWKPAQNTPHLAYIPAELLTKICDEFAYPLETEGQQAFVDPSPERVKESKSALRNLCLVNKRIGACAKRSLYSTIIVDDSAKAISLLRTLEENRRMCQLVKQLSLHPSLLDRIPRELIRTHPELQILDYLMRRDNTPCKASTYICWAIIWNVPELDLLRIHQGPGQRSVEVFVGVVFDPATEGWFPEFRHLQWVPSNVRLSAKIGNDIQVKNWDRMLSHRHLKSLSISFNGHRVLRGLEIGNNMWSTHDHIRHLNIVWESTPLRQLANICNQLPNLESLYIVGEATHTDEPLPAIKKNALQHLQRLTLLLHEHEPSNVSVDIDARGVPDAEPYLAPIFRRLISLTKLRHLEIDPLHLPLDMAFRSDNPDPTARWSGSHLMLAPPEEVLPPSLESLVLARCEKCVPDWVSWIGSGWLRPQCHLHAVVGIVQGWVRWTEPCHSERWWIYNFVAQLTRNCDVQFPQLKTIQFKTNKGMWWLYPFEGALPSPRVSFPYIKREFHARGVEYTAQGHAHGSTPWGDCPYNVCCATDCHVPSRDQDDFWDIVCGCRRCECGDWGLWHSSEERMDQHHEDNPWIDLINQDEDEDEEEVEPLDNMDDWWDRRIFDDGAFSTHSVAVQLWPWSPFGRHLTTHIMPCIISVILVAAWFYLPRCSIQEFMIALGLSRPSQEARTRSGMW